MNDAISSFKKTADSFRDMTAKLRAYVTKNASEIGGDYFSEWRRIVVETAKEFQLPSGIPKVNAHTHTYTHNTSV